MKPLTIILIFILLDSCTTVGQIDINSIKVVKINQHPFLADHERKLITMDKNEKTIDELELYPDSGDGCELYLFDLDSKYILIDCNGQWFSIDKKTGNLKNEGWNWQKKLPDIQLGKFQKVDKESTYVFTRGTDFQESDIYRFKDPRLLNGAQQ